MAKTTDKEATAPASAADERAAKLARFEKVLAAVNNRVQSETGTAVALLGDRPMNVETISSGSVVLDSIAGGGLPKGRLIEIFGPEASGKTSVALTAVGNVQREGGTAAFIDFENALDPKYARKLGVDIDKLALSQPDYAEQGLEIVAMLASSGVVDIIVVDSIAAMVPKAEHEGDMEQQTIGLLARLMSKALRRLITVASRNGCTIIFINQTRDKIGGFSPAGVPQTTPGGKAMKFYASQRIKITKKGPVKEGQNVIGTLVKIKIEKNKIAPPFGEGETVLTFNKGINVAAELVEVAKYHPEVIAMPNNRTYVDAATGEIFAKSKADAVAALEANNELREALAERLRAKLSADLFDGDTLAEEEVVDESDLEEGSELDDKISLEGMDDLTKELVGMELPA